MTGSRTESASEQSEWPGPELIEMARPDDWHLHLRDGAMLKRVLPYTSRVFARAIVMPNLSPPISTVAEALAYRDRILSALPLGHRFEPLMTLYLTPETTPEEIQRAADSPYVAAIKFYPKGATTNSGAGVEGLAARGDVLAALERCDLPLLIHGETTQPDCDVFDRERVFLDETLRPLVERYAGLRVVFEHITTAEAAAFVAEMPARVAATITPQHLLMNRNAIFDGGLRPHHYCLPVLKRERDRAALVEAAVSGDPSFFLGTDSAPHEVNAKESACGCAGIFSAPVAIESYAEAFLRAGRLDRLEGFASHFGPDFYRLPRNEARIRLTRRLESGPVADGQGEDALAVFWAERAFHYHFLDEEA
ncbi:MAG: dihydroorotase [Myxococcota bacterium]